MWSNEQIADWITARREAYRQGGEPLRAYRPHWGDVDVAMQAVRDTFVPQPLQTPDAPGCWAFAGSAWKSERVLADADDPEGFEETVYDEEGEYEGERRFKYRQVLGKPFREIFVVRWSVVGEVVSQRRNHGRYEGEPFLGYVNKWPTWDSYLHTFDHLEGQWWKLVLPWEVDHAAHLL